MGKRTKKEEIEILREIFLNSLRKQDFITEGNKATIMSLFDFSVRRFALYKSGNIEIENEVTKIKILYLEGLSETKISNLLGIGRRRIQGVLKRIGIWEKNRWKNERMERVDFHMNEIKRIGGNKTTGEISEHLGLTTGYVRKLKRRIRNGKS